MSRFNEYLEMVQVQPKDANNLVVLKATKDFEVGLGSNSRRLSPSHSTTIKKGQLYIQDRRGRDGTRWVIYNFERGNPYNDDGKVVCEIAEKHLGSCAGIYASLNKGKMDFQSELKRIIKEHGIK